MGQLAPRNLINQDFSVCADFGQEPIGLANLIGDASTITTLSLIGAIVAASMGGPLAALLVGFTLINDIAYLRNQEQGTLQQSRETLRQIYEFDDGPQLSRVVTIKEFGDYHYQALSTADRAQVKATIASHGKQAALRLMADKFGYDRATLDQEWPGIADQIGLQPAPSPVPPTIIQTPAENPWQALQSTPQIDLADDMGKNPQSAIIAGVPGAGKGILVSNAMRAIKRHNPQVHIFAIDPKADPKERGYWEIADTYHGLRFKDHNAEDSAEWLMSRLHDFQRLQGPKLLILDEGLSCLMTLKLARVYEYRTTDSGKEQVVKVDMMGRFKGFLAYISSMGDSENEWIWLVSQLVNCEDLGLTGGQRAIFRSIALVSPKNKNACENFFSTKFVPLPDGGKQGVYDLMARSPCDRAYYDGKTDQWQPTPIWQNYSGYDRDNRTFIGAL